MMLNILTRGIVEAFIALSASASGKSELWQEFDFQSLVPLRSCTRPRQGRSEEGRPITQVRRLSQEARSEDTKVWVGGGR